MTVPNTQTKVFYSYSVLVNGKEVGSVQSFAPENRKTIERVREVSAAQGTRVKEVVPGIVDVSVTLERLKIYKNDVFTALGADVGNLEDFILPIDIEEQCQHPDGTTDTYVYHGGQLSDFGYTENVRETLIMDRVTVQFAYVTKKA